MATVKLTLDKRSVRKDGTYTVKLYVSHKGNDFFIATSIKIKPEIWINETSPNHNPHTPTTDKLINSVLKQRLIQAEAQIYQLEASGMLNSLDTKTLRNYLTSNSYVDESVNTQEVSVNHILVKDKFAELIMLSISDGTKSIYTQTLVKLGIYYNIDILTFESITLQSLRELENKMRHDGLSINTIGVHMRNLRAVFNRAIDDEQTTNYPFRKFKIKSERTVKRALTIEQLCVLRKYEFNEKQFHQERYRDMFLLVFFLIGINMVDLSALKTISDGRIEFRRAKTRRLYSVKIEPEAMELIRKYKGKNQLLFINDDYKNYKDFLHRMNKNLQEIGTVEMVENGAKNPKDVKRNKKKVTPLFPDITTYWARHTWATIAASLDIPKETIAAALGHGGNTVTDIYIDFDQRKVDAANRKVIDFVNQYTSTNE